MPSDASNPAPSHPSGERDTEALAEEIPCGECGARPLDGYEHCRGMWDDLLARSFVPSVWGRFHREIVDLYSMQHPRRFMKSAISYAAHLTGTCAMVELRDTAWFNRKVQRWLSGRPELDRPVSPDDLGARTIAHVLDDPSDPEQALREWAESIWSAYSEQHGTARRWIETAVGRPLAESDRIDSR